MNRTTFLETLARARTLSGREIYRPGPHRENHLRGCMSVVSWNVVSMLSTHDIPDAVFRDSVEKLRIAYVDPVHYGDNKPGSYFQDGTPAVSDPQFDYFDFIGYALGGEGGFVEFQTIVKLDSKINYVVLFGLIALLLIDDAVTRLDEGDAFFAGADLLRAAECREEMIYRAHENTWRKDLRTQFARAGGRAAHWRTDGYKTIVISEWESGRFQTKVAAARWATEIQKWPVNPDVVERWIREHEKEKRLTQQAE